MSAAPKFLQKLSRAILLRDLERAAAGRVEGERLAEAGRLAEASSSRDAAALLGSQGFVAEARTLLRAADAALDSPPTGGAPESPSPAPADDEERAFHDHLETLTRRLAERARDALTPEAIRRVRRRRIGGLAVACALLALGAGLLVRGSRTLGVKASASWDEGHGPVLAADGLARTEWLLPDTTAGWIEVRLARPRKISRVRLLNARNLPFADRSTRAVHVEALLGGKTVRGIDGEFPGYRPKPTWLSLPVDETVDRLRIDVRTWDLSGGGFGEIEVD